MTSEQRKEPDVADMIAVESLFTITLEGLEEDRHDFAGPFGRRVFERAAGGTVTGTHVKGKVLDLLATDYGRASPDGSIRQFEAEVTIRTDDGIILLMQYRGRESPTYGEGRSRIQALFQVGAGRLNWLNGIQAIGYGNRHGGVTTIEVCALVDPDPATKPLAFGPRRMVEADFVLRRKSAHNPGAERHVVEAPLGNRYLTLAEGGGAFSGPRIQGRFLPGYSWSPHRTGLIDGQPLLQYDVKTLLRTDDDVPVLMSYTGAYSPAYPRGSWMTATLFEVPSGPYAWLNEVQAVGHGRWDGDGAEYRVYALR